MIHKWATRKEAEAAIPGLKPAHPDYQYGPVVLLPGGYAIMVTAKDGKSGFVGEAKAPPPGGNGHKRSPRLEMILWVLLILILFGIASQYLGFFK